MTTEPQESCTKQGGAALEEIRERERAATPGPWGWFGNTDVRDVYLATKHFGRTFVMRFARWGMSGAQPVFYQGRTWKGSPGDPEFTHGGIAADVRDLAVYEVAPSATDRKDPRVYRADLAGIRNPDAEFIAHAREDVPRLLAAVDAVLQMIDEVEASPQAHQAPAGYYLRLIRKAITRELAGLHNESRLNWNE